MRSEIDEGIDPERLFDPRVLGNNKRDQNDGKRMKEVSKAFDDFSEPMIPHQISRLTGGWCFLRSSIRFRTND